MSSCSTYLAQALINHVLRGQAYTAPAACYLALGLDDFTADNITNNEVSGNWYQRKQIQSWKAPTGDGRVTSNSNLIQFQRVDSVPVNITHWGIYDAITSGNLLAYGSFAQQRVVNVGNRALIRAESLQINFDGAHSVHLAQALINHVFRGQPYTPPGGVYLSLYLGSQTKNDNATEVSGTWYSRKSIGSMSAPTGAGHSSANLAAIEFNMFEGSDATIVSWGLKDAATNGNLLYFGDLAAPQVLNDGDVFLAEPGDLIGSIV